MGNLPWLYIRQYKSYVLIALCTFVLVACTATSVPSLQSPTEQVSSSKAQPASVKSRGEQARSADSFVDSIGVHVHLTYEDTAYGNSSIINSRLKELGIRHIRDGGHNEEKYLNQLKELGKAGVKSTLIFQGTPITEVLDVVKKTKGAIAAVEGPNESDLEQFNFSYEGQKFPEGTRVYQKELYTAVKGDSATKYLPVILPSMGWGENAQKLGYLKWGDLCNMHSYPANGERPTYDIDWYFIPHGRTICGKQKPLMVTETGYHNAVRDESGSGISEQAGGKYLPRLLFENFNRNIKRTYLYELIDEWPDPKKAEKEKHFGLLRNDGTRKPSYQTIKNLIALLKEPGANFRPKRLDYKLSGNMTDVHHTLLQKSDGTFYLIVWQDAKSWNNKDFKDVAIPNRKVTLTLNSLISQAIGYQPMRSVKPIWQSSNRSRRIKNLPLNVPDHPLVIKLVAARKK